MAPAPFGIQAIRVAGALLLCAGIAVLVDCFARFAIRGRGTPAPIAPTEALVVSGAYRHTRNPMYVAVVAALIGQGLLLGSLVLLEYAAVVWLMAHAFVLSYEEPALRQQFPEAFEQYRTQVRRWVPRLRPWIPADAGEARSGA
jgi:protein-S-isoprenylcysteine O-methyltransferase Ste14